MNARPRATSATDASQRLGVVDIGSNSIRLVVYDHLSRAPLPIVNRKAVLGLGTDVERLGRLSDPLFDRALASIEALVRMAQDVPVSSLALLATAAVRNAENGDNFCDAITQRTGHDVTVLSGSEEGLMSAMGVISAVPDLTGVVGDMGGGSVELVAVENGVPAERTSLEIGALRLIERADGKLSRAAPIIDAALDGVPWLRDWQGYPFYAVGGAWRAIARLHMAQQDYPLQMVHGYRMSPRETRDFTDMLEHLGPETIAKIRAVSSKRAETLPWGSIALERLARILRPSEYFFSAHGLREGHHFELLDPATQKADPLLTACNELAGQHRRFPDASEAVETWLQPVIERLPGVSERLIRAACILADMGWGEHPTFRAQQSLFRVLRMPWSVLDHQDRAFLALTVFVRYGGSVSARPATDCHRLLDESLDQEAKALGKMLRLAFEICGGRSQILEASAIHDLGDSLEIRLGPEVMAAGIEKLDRYTASASRALGLPIEVLTDVEVEAPTKRAAG